MSNLPYFVLRNPRPGFCVLITVAIASALGCGQGGGDQPLIFDSTTHEFGIVETAGSVRHRFSFRVWDREPVRVSYIGSTCCGTLPVDPNLTGRLLQPGSEHAIDVILGREHTGERAQVDVNIETEPRSSRPIVLSVSGLLIKSVNAHPNPLVIEQSSGSSAAGKVRLTRLRSSDIQQLELDRQNSDFSGLAVRDIYTGTEQVGHPGLAKPRFVDRVEVELSAPESLPDGRHQFACRFAWKNEALAATIIPVTVVVAHPYRPVLDTIFCGEIAAGIPWERSIRMVRQGERSNNNLRIESIHSDTRGVSGEFNEQTDCLELRVQPSHQRGRFEAKLTLVYNDSRVPQFRVQVSGIVPRD
jgi:hypothetical protein